MGAILDIIQNCIINLSKERQNLINEWTNLINNYKSFDEIDVEMNKIKIKIKKIDNTIIMLCNERDKNNKIIF